VAAGGLAAQPIFFLSYLVAISFPIEFDVFTYLLTSVTCSKSFYLLTY
jgi:hypothetical protein